MTRLVRTHAAGALVVLLVGLYYPIGVLWRRAAAGFGGPIFDTYGLFYPNLLYALESLKLGEGLFWNPYQNCGQPFFSIAITGILYPPHLLFLLLDTYAGLYALLFTHLLIAGLGAYWLGRELGLGATAAICGALFFQLSGITLMLAHWEPNLVGHYVWLPAAMAACERGLRDPRASHGVLLGILLTLQFLAGYPPITVFTYQLIGLRVIWQCVTSPSRSSLRGIAVIALGLVLPIGLAAVQLFPSLEFADQSLRNRPLSIDEIRPGHLSLTSPKYLTSAIWTLGFSTALALIPLSLAGLGLVLPRTRGHALFYLLAAGLYTALAFETPLFDLYRLLPLGNRFRMPVRFLWMTGFCVCTAGALGAEVLTADARWLRHRAKSLIFLFLAAAAATVPLHVHWTSYSYVVFAVFSAIVLAALWSPTSNRVARWLLPVAVLASLTFARPFPLFGYASRPSMFYAKQEVFDFLRERMSLQDRMYQITKHTDYALQRKSASIFRIPSITDYETQTSERHAALLVRLLSDHAMRQLNDFYYQGTPIPQNLRLLNLLGVRFVVVDTENFRWVEPPGFRVVWEEGAIRILENAGALPRAFYVPKVEVVRNPDALLARLAGRLHDPRRLALIEQAPEGDLGSEDGEGEVTILEDHGERLTVQVDATRKGFLFVSDQLYPGWRATVNGTPTEILRANYAYRLVPVPEGRATVEFSYRPSSLRIGAWLSALSSLAIVLFLVLRWRLGKKDRSLPAVGA